MAKAWTLIVLVLAAACMDAPAADPYAESTILGSFSDSKIRIANATESEHRFSQVVNVPISANTITVKAIYRSTRDGSFVLKNPQGNGVRFDTFAEPKEVRTDEWFEGRNPPPGTWYLNGHLSKGGAYAFGVYFG